MTYLEPFLREKCFENLHIFSFPFYNFLTCSGIVLKPGDFMLWSGLLRRKSWISRWSNKMVSSGDRKWHLHSWEGVCWAVTVYPAPRQSPLPSLLMHSPPTQACVLGPPPQTYDMEQWVFSWVRSGDSGHSQTCLSPRWPWGGHDQWKSKNVKCCCYFYLLICFFH